MIFIYFLSLIVGFTILIYGADKLVSGATQIARKFNISEVLIGLTIVAMGSSLPELVVSVMSALNGNSGIAVGNVIGSNIANILLILGILGIISRLPVDISKVKFDIIISFIAVIFVLFFARTNVITRIEGISLLLIFTAYLYGTIKITKRKKIVSEVHTNNLVLERESPSQDENIETFIGSTEGNKLSNSAVEALQNISMWKSVLWIIIGLLGLFFGGNVSVFSAKNIATFFGMSDRIIGLTIVAIGTSLPELVTSIVAVRKGDEGIAVGNIIGSNIFNIFFILGLTAVISPINYDSSFHFDFAFVGIVTLLLLLFMWIGKEKKRLEKWEAIILVSLYICYIYYLII